MSLARMEHFFSQILFHSPQAKCLMMENQPVADFEVQFYTGARISWSLEKGVVELRSDATATSSASVRIAFAPVTSASLSAANLFAIGRQINERVPTMYQAQFRHVVDCCKQCWEIAAVTPDRAFPLVLKSGNGGQMATATHGQDATRDAMSSAPSVAPPISVHMSDASTVVTHAPSASRRKTGAMVATGSQASAYRAVGDLRRPPLGNAQPRLNAVPPNGNAASTAELTKNLTATMPTLGSMSLADGEASTRDVHSRRSAMPSACRSQAPSAQPQLLPQAYFRYLPDIGWCVQQQQYQQQNGASPSTEFTLLFNDGERLVIESPTVATSSSSSTSICHVRHYTQRAEGSVNEPDAPAHRYPIDRRLPVHVKRKLAHFPRFVKLF